MWSPLPQIFERAIHGMYSDLGWDIASNRNLRLRLARRCPREAFLTLSDLLLKVESVIAELGYDRKLTDDMRAALITRVSSLCRGSKGELS